MKNLFIWLDVRTEVALEMEDLPEEPRSEAEVPWGRGKPPGLTSGWKLRRIREVGTTVRLGQWEASPCALAWLLEEAEQRLRVFELMVDEEDAAELSANLNRAVSTLRDLNGIPSTP